MINSWGQIWYVDKKLDLLVKNAGYPKFHRTISSETDFDFSLSLNGRFEGLI